VPAGQPQTTRAVLDNSVVVRAPTGYCVDSRASFDRGAQAFVLLASCDSVTGNAAAGRPFAPALLSASVSDPTAGDPPVSEQLSRLKSFFNAPAGRAALSKVGDPNDVRIVSTSSQGNVFIVHARVTEKGRAAAVGPDQWRALFNVNGKLVSASVYALRDRPISSDSGRATLNELVALIRGSSPRPN